MTTPNVKPRSDALRLLLAAFQKVAAEIDRAEARPADVPDLEALEAVVNRAVVIEAVQSLERIAERMQAEAAAALAATGAERAERIRRLCMGAGYAALHGAQLASVQDIRFEAGRDGRTALAGLPLLTAVAAVLDARQPGEEVTLFATANTD